MYETLRFTIEIVSTVLFFILAWFMLKPYRYTRESRYLGLPLGFTFMGVSDIFLAIGVINPFETFRIVSLITRTFAFVFLTVTYFFSKKPSKNSQLIWNATLSLLIVFLITTSLLLVSIPQFGIEAPTSLSVAFRIIDLLCIIYISIQCLRSHIQKPEPTTIWIPIGYIFFGISQYSLLIRAMESDYSFGFAFFGGLTARLIGIAIFLIVTYSAFHRPKNGGTNEKNTA